MPKVLICDKCYKFPEKFQTSKIGEIGYFILIRKEDDSITALMANLEQGFRITIEQQPERDPDFEYWCSACVEKHSKEL